MVMNYAQGWQARIERAANPARDALTLWREDNDRQQVELITALTADQLEARQRIKLGEQPSGPLGLMLPPGCAAAIMSMAEDGSKVAMLEKLLEIERARVDRLTDALVDAIANRAGRSVAGGPMLKGS